MVLGTEFRFSFSSTKLAPASDIYPWLGMRQDLPKQHGQHILQMWSRKIQNLMVELDFGDIFGSALLPCIFYLVSHLCQNFVHLGFNLPYGSSSFGLNTPITFPSGFLTK